MPETTWDEVGQRFADLGRELQKTWQQGGSTPATSQLKDAGDRVRAALDEVALTINQTAKSPDVHAAAREATTGLADALSATLGQVVDWMERVPGRGGAAGKDGDDERPAPPDPDVDDVQDATGVDDIQDAVIVDDDEADDEADDKSDGGAGAS